MQIISKNENRLAEKNTLHSLHGIKKIQYIWDYYKLLLIFIVILLYCIGYFSYRHFSYKKPILSIALVNVTIGETLTRQFSENFLKVSDITPSKNQVRLYTGLYLTEDETNPYHEYSYASRIKILASIDAQQLDIVLMNQEAFDAFSQNGYLCNLDALLLQEDAFFYKDIASSLVNNTVILEDNKIDLQFDSSISYYAVTEEYPMGLNLSQAYWFEQAGFEEAIYLGIIENSLHKDTAVKYMQYLYFKN